MRQNMATNELNDRAIVESVPAAYLPARRVMHVMSRKIISRLGKVITNQMGGYNTKDGKISTGEGCIGISRFDNFVTSGCLGWPTRSD